MFYVICFLQPLPLFVLILHNVSKCSDRVQDIEVCGRNHWLLCYIHFHACIQKPHPRRKISFQLLEGNELFHCPLLSLSLSRRWPLFQSRTQCEGACGWAAWTGLRFRGLWLKCLALSWGPQAWALFRASPAALASISAPCLPGYWSGLCQVWAVPNTQIIH